MEGDERFAGIRRRLEAVSGYLELRMFEDAAAELDGIPPPLDKVRQVEVMRALVWQAAGDWRKLREVSHVLVKQWPDDANHWIWLAYATRRCRSLDGAEEVLLDALRFHETEPVIHFNLACYAAQLGKLDLARLRLGEAIKLDPRVREMALGDSDMEPLWPELRAAR